MEAIPPRATLTEQVVAQLREAVLTGQIQSGERYSAVELAQRFGVSRTPIREALLELERDGLVRIDKNRGVSVVPTSLDEVVECFQVRLLLEVPAAYRAVDTVDKARLEVIERRFASMQHAADQGDIEALLRADRDFHLELLAGADNVRLVRALESLRNLVLTTGMATVPGSRTCQELVEDHRDIIQGVRDRSPHDAAAAMRRHILNTATLLINREAEERLSTEMPRPDESQKIAPTQRTRHPRDVAELTAKLLSLEVPAQNPATPKAKLSS